MQAAKARPCRNPCARCLGVGVPPPGISFLHACSARWNCAEPRSSEPAEITPWAFGSGKLGSPFARMQAESAVISRTLPTTENATPLLPPPPGLLASSPELPAGPLELDPLAVALDLVVVPRLATAGGCDPPQPAVTTPRLARMAARNSFPTAHRKAPVSKTTLIRPRRIRDPGLGVSACRPPSERTARNLAGTRDT